MGKRKPESARETLIERRRMLMRRTEGTLAEEQRLLEEVEPDWQDQAATLSAVMLLDRMSDVELMQLRRVQAALDRLDAGTYGRCVQCRQPIERARLRVLPETDRCCSCACSN
jgi:RNA polymerase-binding transcription factor DksA